MLSSSLLKTLKEIAHRVEEEVKQFTKYQNVAIFKKKIFSQYLKVEDVILVSKTLFKHNINPFVVSFIQVPLL